MECCTVHSLRKHPWEIIASTIYRIKSNMRRHPMSLITIFEVYCRTWQLSIFFFGKKILGRGLGSTQSKGRAPNSWSTGACPCGLWSMTSKPFMSVHTGRLLSVSLSYGDASPSAAMETQQSVTPQDRTRAVVDNPTLIVQSLRHWTHGRWVVLN